MSRVRPPSPAFKNRTKPQRLRAVFCCRRLLWMAVHRRNELRLDSEDHWRRAGLLSSHVRCAIETVGEIGNHYTLVKSGAFRGQLEVAGFGVEGEAGVRDGVRLAFDPVLLLVRSEE